MRILGYALAILGAALLVAYGGYHFVVGFVLNADIPLVVRVGFATVVFGVLLVVASLVWERLRDKRRESFGEVDK